MRWSLPLEEVERWLESRRENEDPIDLAVLAGLKDEQVASGQRVVHFQPFDPVHKRTEAAIQGADGKTFKVTKGAPQVIKIYAESFRGADNLRRILEEAQAIVDEVIGASSTESQPIPAERRP